jgi:hypothetical protein
MKMMTRRYLSLRLWFLYLYSGRSTQGLFDSIDYEKVNVNPGSRWSETPTVETAAAEGFDLTPTEDEDIVNFSFI